MTEYRTMDAVARRARAIKAEYDALGYPVEMSRAVEMALAEGSLPAVIDSRAHREPTTEEERDAALVAEAESMAFRARELMHRAAQAGLHLTVVEAVARVRAGHDAY